jgi:diacylglycerol kinase (ATP)
MTAHVILNPYSGRGRAARLRGEMEAALNAVGMEYELTTTTHPQHAIVLAAAAFAEGASPIIAAGGDGLVSEVVNGLLKAQPDGILGPLGVMPLGTANDLAVNLGLPLGIPEAAATIAAGHTRTIDLGQVGDWVFDNNSAVGLEPVVTLYNIEMVRLRGVIRYLVAAVRAILAKRSWQMQLSWDDGSYEGPVSLVSVGNNPLTGGLFKMAPAADPTDGLLTFVHAFAPSRRKMFALLPRTITGKYVDDPAVHQHHTSWLRIRCQPPSPLQVDGEIRSTDLTEIEYRALPERLQLLAPEASGLTTA